MRAHLPLTLLVVTSLAAVAAFGAVYAHRAGIVATPAVTAEALPPSGATASAAARKSADSDGDRIPDQLELVRAADRENFRSWFAYVAEMQFYRASEWWHTDQRDCAGLIRFAWREALRRHDRLWLKRMGAEYDLIAPDVAAYTLDRAPFGERLFRTGDAHTAERDDSMTPPDANAFAEFADARTLREFNTRFISRDKAAARTGDLLFFHQPWGARFPHHVMLYVGASQAEREAESDVNDWVVYHTGASPDDAGTVKKVRLDDLARHPDPRWRPVAGNPRFLGFFRLKILD